MVGKFGFRTIRESARWHLIEQTPLQFDFRSLESILDAADANEAEVILDLLHFGWPDHVDPLSQRFDSDFATFVEALARYLRSRGAQVRYISPVNEISFLAWAGGEAGTLNPCRTDCAGELKRNLVRAALRASEVLLGELPGVRLVAPEPIIHIVPNTEDKRSAAEAHCASQYEAWDMLCGRLEPQLGGRPEFLDIIGANHYIHNQWVHEGEKLSRSDARFRPLRDMLTEVWTRYQRPILLSETGAEGDERAPWFQYVCEEVRSARASGIPVEGICLYPILNHAGWDDDRHCHNGLFDFPNEHGMRPVYWPLAQAVCSEPPFTNL